MDHWNLSGWQWLFVIEGLASSLVGVSVWFLMPDYPHSVSWLTPDEKMMVMNRLKDDHAAGTSSSSDANASSVNVAVKAISWREVRDTMLDKRVLTMSGLFFVMLNCAYIQSFFMPAVVKEMLDDPVWANLLTAPIYSVAIVASLSNSIIADRTGKYHWCVAGACTIGMISYLALAYALTGSSFIFKYAATIGAASASYATIPPYLAWFTLNLRTSTASAVGTAMIVSIGNVGGFVGPQIMSFSEKWYGTLGYGLGVAGVLEFLAVIGVLLLAWWQGDLGGRKSKGYEQIVDHEPEMEEPSWKAYGTA
eukprot:TRINITY_DN3167_c0_g1_i2.p1 TRINITY_DN3167_c0_g1~~TRINITY_DN3167_c0_g1_i2.p1  ORF type:complete len:308 (-),score=56.22 TRINITY_DN3167_c0_g1_i2:23-946(-)